MATGKTKYDEVRTLFKKVGTEFVLKTNEEFILAIKEIIKGKNKNDIPFTVNDIKKTDELKDFSFKGMEDFKYYCDLVGIPLVLDEENKTWKNEKISAEGFPSNELRESFNTNLGAVYMITAIVEGKEYIIKIGQTRTSLKARLGSYNCGVVRQLRTASTTNIKIVQSILCSGVKFKMYAIKSMKQKTYDWCGIKSTPFATSKTLAFEDILIKQYIKQFGRKPLANVQANATK